MVLVLDVPDLSLVENKVGPDSEGWRGGWAGGGGGWRVVVLYST
jgi:hypothetical protein